MAIFILALSSAAARPQPLTIAAASDLRFALDEVLEPFRAARPEARVDVVYGSSGKLATQIRNGAPFDVYLAADRAFAQGVHDAGLGAGPPVVYAIGRLVLWSRDAALVQQPLAQVISKVNKFAIANPAHAPYGQRAVEALRSQALLASAQRKFVLGENVAQAAQFVDSGAADAGLVAHSLVLAPALAGKGGWVLIPETWHSPLEQAFIVTRRGGGNALAGEFAQHLQSAPAREVLRRHGFALPGEGR